jgi:hypothetical protein
MSLLKVVSPGRKGSVSCPGGTIVMFVPIAALVMLRQHGSREVRRTSYLP